MLGTGWVNAIVVFVLLGSWCDVVKSSSLRASSSLSTEKKIVTPESYPQESRPSDRSLQGASLTEVPIVGGVTTTSAVFGFRTDVSAKVRIRYARNRNMNNPTVTPFYRTKAVDDFTGSITVNNLVSDTEYFYEVMVDQVTQDQYPFAQRFQTFPLEGQTVQFSVFADAGNNPDSRARAYRYGGCCGNVTVGSLFALQIGDFDHSDPTTLDDLRSMHRRLRNPVFEHGEDFATFVASKMSLAHVWDDHDYCGQDTDRFCPSKAEALQAYKEYYPGYDLEQETLGIWHKFTVADAEIFMLDARSQRDPDVWPNNSTKSMLDGYHLPASQSQKEWLKNGLLTSTAKWKLIVSSVTANTAARVLNIDHWMTGFPDEALEMRNFIADNNITNTLMISGDLHTGGGLDNGSNNGWGIPEMNIAHTNLNGGNGEAVGRWSHGISEGIDGNMGFGLVTVTPDKLYLESKDSYGNTVHSMTLPDDLSDQIAILLTCSSNIVPQFPTPSAGVCVDIERNVTHSPPFPTVDNEDGQTYIDNNSTIYTCAASDKRVILSNGIPDHSLLIDNPNLLCKQNWRVELPLTPTLLPNGGKTETSNIVGFALNGVVAFNAQEIGTGNAAEPKPDSLVLDAQYWWGHATGRNIWHYHTPSMGREISTIDEMTLLGYAMDGFPIFGPLADPDSVLDECNFNEVTLRYHVRTKDQVDETLGYCNGTSEATNWRYIVGCFRGETSNSFILDTNDWPHVDSDCLEDNIFTF